MICSCICIQGPILSVFRKTEYSKWSSQPKHVFVENVKNFSPVFQNKKPKKSEVIEIDSSRENSPDAEVKKDESVKDAEKKQNQVPQTEPNQRLGNPQVQKLRLKARKAVNLRLLKVMVHNLKIGQH